MAVHSLQNKYIKLVVSTSGAEMKSLFNQQAKKEMLWQGEQIWWSRQAPLLFPIVGRLKNDSYKLGDKTYSLSQHGFARDQEFEIASTTIDELVLTLKDNEETFNVYPFQFRLAIKYRLQENKVIITYEIENRGRQVMPFSVGAHPAFNCPTEDHLNFNDYDLIFSQKEKLARRLLEDGIRTNFESINLKDGNRLELSLSLFEKDAIIIEELNSNSVSLASGNEKVLTVHFPDFNYLGFWTKPGAPFICIEPWNGLADPTNTDHELTTKEGIILLNPGEIRSYSYSIRIH